MEPAPEMTYDAKFTDQQKTSHSNSNARKQSKNRKHDEGIEVVEDFDTNKPRQTRTAVHRELDHTTHNFTPKAHPVWQYFSTSSVFLNERYTANQKVVTQYRVLAVCNCCGAHVETHSELSRDISGEDEIEAIRQIMHDAIHHLKSDCTKCPNTVHREVRQWSAAGSSGHADQNEPAQQAPLESLPEKPAVPNVVSPSADE